MTSEVARRRAEQSVAASFTRIMNATTSRWGMLSDPPIVAMLTAPGIIGLLAALRLELAPSIVTAVQVVTALPILVALVVSLALRGARGRVVEWLAGAPFPIENVNALLNGLGESLEVTFEGRCPSSAELNAELDAVSPESFVVKVPEGELPAGERALVEVRIGVVDSTRNPAGSNHRRFERVRALVDGVLVPLAGRFPIAEVRVK